MPRFVIERQFLVPVYEHILVEAPSLELACRQALDEDAQSWGDDSEIGWDDSRATTIAQAVKLPETLEAELCAETADRRDLSLLLYDCGLELLRIPAEFAEEVCGGEEGIGFS